MTAEGESCHRVQASILQDGTPSGVAPPSATADTASTVLPSEPVAVTKPGGATGLCVRRRMTSPVLSQLASSDAADWNSTRGCIPHAVCVRAAVRCAIAVPRTDTRTRNPHSHSHLHPRPHRTTRSPARPRRRSPPTLPRRCALASSFPPPRLHPPPTSPVPRLKPNPNLARGTQRRRNRRWWTRRRRTRSGRWGMSSEMNRLRRAMVALHHTKRAGRGRRSERRSENA